MYLGCHLQLYTITPVMAEYAYNNFSLMLQEKIPVVERIYPQSNKFALGVENKGTGSFLNYVHWVS